VKNGPKMPTVNNPNKSINQILNHLRAYKTLEDPGHSQEIHDPYPDRIRQILVKMPRANPDKMGPKCLKSQIDDPDKSTVKYYSLSIIRTNINNMAQFFLGYHSKSRYLSLRLKSLNKNLILRTNFHSSFL
jgi:hypothetical protein